jgi:hypothetical protein
MKLYEIQKAFKKQILSAVPTNTPLEVHRYHTFYTLQKTLARTFNQTRKFLGEEEFSALTQKFIEESPPCNPYLCLYGEKFPSLLQDPLLKDLAVLEWCLQESLNAYEESESDFLVKLAEIDPDDFDALTVTLNPTLRLFKSVYNLKPLFTKESLSEIDFALGEFYFLCKTEGVIASVHILSADQGVFLGALELGDSFGVAHEKVVDRNPNFSLQETLAHHFGEKNFVDFKI